MSHERSGISNEWYTPKYIFDNMGCIFDTDVASPTNRTFCHVPAKSFITEDSLNVKWNGFIWMNPPYGNQKSKFLWIDKFISHANGVALMPDRTSAPWWQYFAKHSEAILFLNGKIKFVSQSGALGVSPSNGTTLFSLGEIGSQALLKAGKNGLGKMYRNS